MLTDAQREMRRSGIGGSEIASILGLNPWSGPLDVYLAKVEGWEQPMTAPMERGTFLEPGIAAWYGHRTGRALRTTGTLQHPSHLLVLCTPDYLARGPRDDLWIDLSIKAPGFQAAADFGEDGTDEVPESHLLQVQWELEVLFALGEPVAETADLAALLNDDLHVWPIRRDPELGGLLVEQAERWWRDHVVARVPPPIDGSDTATEWVKRRFPRDTRPMLDAEPRHDLLALELQESELLLVEAKERKDQAANLFKEAIGDAAGVAGPWGKVTWKADKNGKRSLRTNWRKQ